MGKRGNGEGSIYKDSRGLYRAALSDPESGKRKVFSGKTREIVAKKLTTALQEQEDGMLVTAARQTVAQHLETWLADVVRPNLRPRSYVAYSSKVRLHILPAIGRLQLTALTPQHLQRLYAAKHQTLAPKSVNNLHVVVHRALEYALRWGLVKRNVADAVEAPRVPRRELQPFTPPELGTLLSAMKDHRHESLWLLMLMTGIRFGEAAALRWQDVDLEHRLLQIRHTLGAKGAARGPMFTPPKTEKGRRDVPLPLAAVQILNSQLVTVELARRLPDWQEHNLVFPSLRGTPLNESHVLPRFQQLLSAAGLPKRRMHDLRHTYATRLFAMGQHPRAVQDLLGHSRYETTMNLYTASVPETLREAADHMDTVISAARQHAAPIKVAAVRASATHHGRVATPVATPRPPDDKKTATSEAI